MTSRDDYRKRMQRQLAQWSFGMNSLEVRANQAKTEHKKRLMAELTELRRLETAGRQVCSALELIAASTWEKTQVEVADQWNHVTAAVDVIWARVQLMK